MLPSRFTKALCTWPLGVPRLRTEPNPNSVVSPHPEGPIHRYPRGFVHPTRVWSTSPGTTVFSAGRTPPGSSSGGRKRRFLRCFGPGCGGFWEVSELLRVMIDLGWSTPSPGRFFLFMFIQKGEDLGERNVGGGQDGQVWKGS